MGQEIVYCYRCQNRLLGSDFEKGHAFRVGGQVSCPECVREFFAGRPPAEIDAEIAKLRETQVAKRSGNTSRIPVARSASPESTSKVKSLPAPEPAPSNAKLYMGIGGIAVVLVILAALMMSSGSRPQQSQVAQNIAPTPLPAPKPEPGPAPSADLPAGAFVDIDRIVATRVGSDDFSAAARDLDKARSRRSEPGWTAGIDERRARLEEKARAALPGFLDPALAAHHEGRADEVERLRSFIAAFPALAAEFDQRLASKPTTPKPTPAPTPKPAAKPSTSPKPPATEAASYKSAWDKAMASRDPAAIRSALEGVAKGLKSAELKTEAAQDLELIKLAAPVRAEGLAALPKYPKEQKVTLEFRDDTSIVGSFEGTIASADAVALRLVTETGTLTLPVSELSDDTLARIYAERPGKGATDARAAAVFAAIRAGVETAKKLDATLPAKYLDFAAKPLPAEPDGEARRSFWAAFAEAVMSRSRATGLDRLSKIGAPRYKPFVDLLMEGAKDAFYSGTDFATTGSFTSSEREKVGAVWLSTADLTKGHASVEAEYYALPDQTYRAWVLAGGCCLEVFSFTMQATDLKGIDPKTKQETAYDPGDGPSMAVKLPSLSLKKIHSQHLGPKEPDRWEWIPLALPKSETAGVRKLRLLTDQKGFAVAHMVISATKTRPPSAAELKELLRDRTTAPRFALAPGPAGGKPTRTAYCGGAGGADFEEMAPPGAVLVGLKYSAKGAGGKMKYLQAIFRLGDQTTRGGGHGTADTSAELVARPGYAVGQMVLASSDRLDGFKLVFMRQAGGRLLPGDRYESPWVGVPAKGETTTLGDGSPVGGIFGHAGGEIDGAGLILLK